MVERVLKERYAIQKQLGKNAGRQTWLARDLQTQELVAIKILSFGADFQWDDLKLFEREAETLQSLSHPAIPRYLDHFEFQTPKTKRLALVQSYIQAKSLEEWVKLGRSFSEEEIKQLAQSLLEILMYLHGQHPPVIHRDIKPSNILLGERSGNSTGQVYLVDFGSVQTLTATEGSTLTVVGTYGYMPPEQFGGRAVPASDLYGLGATLIYLVTGTHPAELPQEDLRIQFKPKLYLSSAFIDWLKWITEPDLNSRLTSADKAIKALGEPKQREEKFPVVQKNTNSKVVQKPAETEIQLKKDRDTLEIIIPPDSERLIGCLFIYGLFVTMSIVFFYNSLLVILIFYSFSGLKLLLDHKLTTLRIDRQKISLTDKWFGLVRCHRLPPRPRQTICKLRFIRYFDPKLRVLRRRYLQIWAGIREYKLSLEHLTEDEVDWIAYELSEWLDLPIN